MLGGFSMGTVMSYALGLGPERPSPAGILALSGFIPTVDGWQPDLLEHRARRVHRSRAQRPGHRRRLSRGLHAGLLEGAGVSVEYHESDAGHTIDPASVPPAIDWLAALAIRFA